MNGENWPLVTDEPVELEKQVNWSKFKTSGKFTSNRFRGIHGIYFELIQKTRTQTQKITPCHRIDLETLGSSLIMPQNLPGDW